MSERTIQLIDDDRLVLPPQTRTGWHAGMRHAEPAGSGRSVRRTAPMAGLAHRLSRILAPTLFVTAITVLLVLGWQFRDEGYLSPETGIGYWLGITGASLMLLLLLYPLRKRLGANSRFGRLAGWFRIHMILGIVGPALVLLHSNFRLGSLNSNVALFAMLIVVASGIVGRYIYARIHSSLYGRKTDVREILADAQALRDALGGDVVDGSELLAQLQQFEHRVLRTPAGALSSFGALLTLGWRVRRRRHQLFAQVDVLVREEARAQRWSLRTRRMRRKAARDHMRMYFSAVKKAAAFAFYERLFALWHLLHLPLFLLLVLAAVFHIIAVHLY